MDAPAHGQGSRHSSLTTAGEQGLYCGRFEGALTAGEQRRAGHPSLAEAGRMAMIATARATSRRFAGLRATARSLAALFLAVLVLGCAPAGSTPPAPAAAREPTSSATTPSGAAPALLRLRAAYTSETA